MTHFLKLYLVITGAGAALAVLFPSLVVVGFFLFILPGLILSLMPAAFLYGLAFTIVWLPLQHVVGPWLASAVAVPAVVASFWYVATPGHEQGLSRLAAVTMPDVMPVAPIVLSGDVRIDAQQTKRRVIGRGTSATSRIVCNGICASALFTPGVQSVTITSWRRTEKPEGYAFGGEALDSGARTFRLVPLEGCTGDREAPDLSDIGPDLAAEITLRLSRTHCIVSEAPLNRHDMQLVIGEYWILGERLISPDWSSEAKGVRVDRLELRGLMGEVLLRRMITETPVLNRPLHPWGTGELQSFRFGWARSNRSNSRRYATIEPVDLLRSHTNMKLDVDRATLGAETRAQLRALLSDPGRAADDAGYALPEAVFSDIRKRGLQPGDADLVEAIVADPRTRELSGIFDVVKAVGQDAVRLRDPIIARILSAEGDVGSARTLGMALAWLPPGTFAQPTQQEQALMTDPRRRDNARGLFERQADRGPEAAPFLLDILANVFRRRALAGKQSGPELEQNTLEGIRTALAVLGPEIAEQRPRLEALLMAQPGREGRRRTWHWEVALVRMGASPNSFEKPSSHGGSQAAYHEHLRRDIQRFERDLAKRG